MDRTMRNVLKVISYRAHRRPLDLDVPLQRSVISELSKRWLAMAAAPWYLCFKPQRGIA